MTGKLTAGIVSAARFYSDTKLAIEQALPFDADWLHLAIGPAIFVVAALVLRRPQSGWGPWLVVAALAVANEIVDVTEGAANSHESAYFEAATDFLLTVAIPTLLVIVARFRPTLYERIGLSR